MKKILIMTLLITTILGCNNSTSQEVKKISPTAFQTQLTKSESAVLIDVRTPEEFAEGHLEGAVNINVNDKDFETKLNALEKDNALLLYCRSGMRSGKASKIASQQGFKEIYDMFGGISGWMSEGLPVKK